MIRKRVMMKRICFKATLNIQDSVKQEGGLERLELEHLGQTESFLMSLTAVLVGIVLLVITAHDNRHESAVK